MGILDGNRQADCPAHAVTDQGSTRDPQPVHELIYQTDKILNSVSIAFLARFPETPKVKGVGSIEPAQVSHGFLPKSP